MLHYGYIWNVDSLWIWFNGSKLGIPTCWLRSKLPLLVTLKILGHTFEGWSIMFPVWNVEMCCINIIINHPSFWETHLEFCWFSSMFFPAINLYRWTFPSCRAPFSLCVFLFCHVLLLLLGAELLISSQHGALKWRLTDMLGRPVWCGRWM